MPPFHGRRHGHHYGRCLGHLEYFNIKRVHYCVKKHPLLDLNVANCTNCKYQCQEEVSRMFYIVHYRRRSILMLFSSLLGGLRSVTMATECFIVLKYTYSKSPAIIGLQKKFREACFHVRYRACSSAANVSALLFKVDFPLSNS